VCGRIPPCIHHKTRRRAMRGERMLRAGLCGSHLPPGVCLCPSIARGQATECREGHERPRHARHCPRMAHQADHGPGGLHKKAPAREHVHHPVLHVLHPEHVDGAMRRAAEMNHGRGLTSALDERWRDARSQVNPRWVGHTSDPHSSHILAHVCERRQDTVLLQLSVLLEPCGMTRYDTDGWGAYERHLDPDKQRVGKDNTQTMARTHLPLRPRLTRVVRRTIWFSTTDHRHDRALGLGIHGYAGGRAV
jgi:insertion element IS1 protein InsB